MLHVACCEHSAVLGGLLSWTTKISRCRTLKTKIISSFIIIIIITKTIITFVVSIVARNKLMQDHPTRWDWVGIYTAVPAKHEMRTSSEPKADWDSNFKKSKKHATTYIININLRPKLKTFWWCWGGGSLIMEDKCKRNRSADSYLSRIFIWRDGRDNSPSFQISCQYPLKVYVYKCVHVYLYVYVYAYVYVFVLAKITYTLNLI